MAVLRKSIKQIVRSEIEAASAQKETKAPSRLTGRGHEARLAIDVPLDAILRGADVYKDVVLGRSGGTYYSQRTMKIAQDRLEKRLGWSPLAISGTHAWLMKEGPTELYESDVVTRNDT